MQSTSPWPGHARFVHQLDRVPEDLLGERVRLRRRREARNMTLEEQFVPCWIFERERHHRAQERLQRGPWLTRERERSKPGEQLSVAVGEHRVVQRVLRVEVLVQRGLTHPDLAGQGMQRDPGDPVLPSEHPRGGDDRGDLGLSTLRNLVGHLSTSGGARPAVPRRQAGPTCRSATNTFNIPKLIHRSHSFLTRSRSPITDRQFTYW